MSQLTRSSLKSIIKECLIEILAEGLNGPDMKLSESLRMHEQKKSSNVDIKTSIKHNSRPENSVKKFNNTVSSIARSLTNDNIMASLLEDTARTTLQEQIENDPELMLKNKNVDGLIAPRSSEDIPEFDEKTAANWSALAFGMPKRNK